MAYITHYAVLHKFYVWNSPRKIKTTTRMYPSYKSQNLLIHSTSCRGKEVCSGWWNWV